VKLKLTKRELKNLLRKAVTLGKREAVRMRRVPKKISARGVIRGRRDTRVHRGSPEISTSRAALAAMP
jgi:hypothetical protein